MAAAAQLIHGAGMGDQGLIAPAQLGESNGMVEEFPQHTKKTPEEHN